MEEPGTIYATGTAGAGKTHFVQAMATWMKSAGYDVITVNLDPGHETAAFEPDVDVREWVRLADVMDEYGLGPNGAQVAAADLIALKVFEIKQAIAEFKTDYILVDTPGQVELFAFRESSKAIVEALSGDRSTVAFLFDPALARSAPGFVSLLMLAATVEFRFRLPMLNVLTKSDILTPEQLTEILGWGENPSQLADAVGAEERTPDVQLTNEVLRAIEALAPMTTLLATSAKEGTGLEEIYRATQRNFSGGEDLEPSHGPSDDAEPE